MHNDTEPTTTQRSPLLSNSFGGPAVTVVIVNTSDANSAANATTNALAAMSQRGWLAEVVLVTDAPSSDVAAAAITAGARVLFEPTPNRSTALRSGIAVARGDLVVTFDASAPDVDLAGMVQSLLDASDVVVARPAAQSVSPAALAFSKVTAERLELASSGAELEVALIARAITASLTLSHGHFQTSTSERLPPRLKAGRKGRFGWNR